VSPNRRFTLYWTSLDRYEKCPQAFLWYRGWGEIDCGGGPGRKKPKPFKSSRHHAVMGIVIQAVIERMYNDELWRQPKLLSGRLTELTDREFALALGENYCDFRQCSKAEMLETCHKGVQGYLRTMKEQRLLGPYARAEQDLVAFVNKWTPIGGRPDVIIRRLDTGLSILDGKNSMHKGRYTDPDQLRFYALCFYLIYKILVDRLGFVYYRYPYGTPIEGTDEVEQGVDWIEFTKEDLKGLAQRAVDALKAMDREKFDPTPTPSNCRLCDYETVCEARQSTKRTRKPKNSDLQDQVEAAGGVVDLEL